MKKQKIILYAIGNEENFNYYIFEKRQEIYDFLAKLLYSVFKLSAEYYEANGKKIGIEKYRDHHQHVFSVGNKSRVDIFYGSKKMFVTINCSEKLRLKFNEALAKISEMPKPKPIKRIRKKRKK